MVERTKPFIWFFQTACLVHSGAICDHWNYWHELTGQFSVSKFEVRELVTMLRTRTNLIVNCLLNPSIYSGISFWSRLHELASCLLWCGYIFSICGSTETDYKLISVCSTYHFYASDADLRFLYINYCGVIIYIEKVCFDNQKSRSVANYLNLQILALKCQNDGLVSSGKHDNRS